MVPERPKVGIGIIVKKGNKIILQKRKGAHGEGMWSLPGGHLEFSESFEDCARREVMEEANIKIKNIRFLCITNDIMKNDSKHYITIFFEADYDSGELKMNEPDRTEEIGWFDVGQMPEPLFLPLKNLAEGKSYPQVNLCR